MSEVQILSKIRALKTILRQMKYAGLWNESSLAKGDPTIYLLLLNFFFLEFSPEVKLWLIEKGYPLQTATDLVFIQQIFKILQSEFNNRSKISVENFIKPKFALQKINMVTDISKLVQQKAANPKIVTN